jgi:hypothetical protein
LYQHLRHVLKTLKQTSANNDHLRVLTLLASCPNGCSGATLLVEHDHASETIVGLIHAGLASLQTKHLGKPIHARFKITAKGRLALRVPGAKIETHDEAVNATLKAYRHLTYEEAEKITTAFGF